ncbi:helix-turn-helix domain-containing protein [Cuneatibacter sp. NSJ-177]|uniref:PucR family transcriptional regulator n=1 Tax=Cuneatibacter sp. NSJ-177 TaxID=2931401 RepID=UPI001FD0C87E|nr:helix-turn-helix domain-containing protein [Cuneatibacter sp. NSJ-177]MCJ7834623.1 helix-turn-helix domain-containing protein [Cuneatibacter sp. NSJ-177]
MDVSDLINELSSYHPLALNMCDHCRSFSQVMKIPESRENFQEDTLYIGTVSQAKRHLSNINFLLLLLIRDQESIPSGWVPGNTIYLFDRMLDSEKLLLQCRSILKTYDAYLHHSSNLLNLMLTGSSLESMVDAAALILQNPLVVVDLNFKILAFSHEQPLSNHQWLRAISRGYCSFEFIAEFQQSRQVQEASSSKRPFSVLLSDGMQICVSKMMFQQQHSGYLIAFEHKSPFSWMNTDLMVLASNVISYIVKTQNELDRTIHGYYGEHIIIECLMGEFKNRQGFQERIRNTEFEQPALYRVIVIDVEHYQNFDPKKEVLKEQFSKMFLSSWTIWCMGHVVCVVNTSEMEDTFPEILEAEREFFLDKHLRLGISDTFSDLYEIAAYDKQSLRTLDLSAKLRPEHWFCFYDDYKFYDLIQSTSHTRIENFFSVAFRKVQNYDQENHTDYLETIYEYLICGKNLNKTANKLYVHKNTVSYRIGKAKELFGIDLANTRISVYFLYSYWMMQMLDLQMLEEVK